MGCANGVCCLDGCLIDLSRKCASNARQLPVQEGKRGRHTQCVLLKVGARVGAEPGKMLGLVAQIVLQTSGRGAKDSWAELASFAYPEQKTEVGMRRTGLGEATGPLFAEFSQTSPNEAAIYQTPRYIKARTRIVTYDVAYTRTQKVMEPCYLGGEPTSSDSP